MKRETNRISLNHQVVMWHAGLRGAIAYALAITFPSHHQNVIISTTSFVVLFTVFCLGGTTVPMLKFLSVRRGVEEDHATRAKVVRSAKAESAMKSAWIRFASERLVPWLQKDSLEGSEEDALVLDTDGVGLGGGGEVEITSASAWDMGDGDDEAFGGAAGGGGSTTGSGTLAMTGKGVV